jgi:serine/threonine protein kinase
LLDSYELGSLIGKGGYSQVYKALNKNTSETVAIKMIKKANMNAKDLSFHRREIDMLKAC